MPDDLSELADEIEDEFVDDCGHHVVIRKPTPEPPKLPKARVVSPPEPLHVIARAWIRWLPASIAFTGLAFVAWMVVQVVFVGRYHDALGRLELRVKTLEGELVKAKAAEAVEYWSHQCDKAFQRGELDGQKH